MSVSQEIKGRLDIVDVISGYMPLRRAGQRYSGFCPFHPNTRTPAFFVFPETQSWHCFGACATGGDVFTFIMRKEGMEFKEALRYLAEKAGVKLEEQTPERQARQEAGDRLANLLELAADYFHQLFLYAPQAEEARRYVARRALSAETIAVFKLGYALDSWDAGRNHFQAQGFDIQELTAAGLVSIHEERGTAYDRFRQRLMIPIRDVNGQMAGFGARTLEKDGLPKYLNSPQTALFDKSSLLFGLDQARRHIREARQAVIVEGYMDVLQAWQAGFRNVVAQMGTALTEAQLNLLKRFTRRFVIALDADAAGAKATLRSLEVARETLDREADSRFDARGLIRHEGRLKADIRIVTLPEGQDPDDLIRQDAAAWPVLIQGAQPVAAYVIEVLTRATPLDDPKVKSAAAQQIAPLIQDVADPVERDHYWQMLARALQVDERALRRLRVDDSRRKASATPPVEPATAAPDGDHRQLNYLRQCLQASTLIRRVDELLDSVQQLPVQTEDFRTLEDGVVWQQLTQHTARGRRVVTLDELCDSLDETLSARVTALQALPEAPAAELERLPLKLARSVLDWRLDQVNQVLGQLSQLMAEAEQVGEKEKLEMYRSRSQALASEKSRINRAKRSLSAMG